MSSSSASLCCMTTLIFLTFIWLCICFIAPYWKTIQSPKKIDLGKAGKLFPIVQEFLDHTTKLLSQVSINIGVVFTCIDIIGHDCSRNDQIRALIPFIPLPAQQHILNFVLALALLFVAFLLSFLLACCPNSCLFCLSIVSIFASVIMLIIAVLNMYSVIGTFNNWASFGFIVGVIVTFILLIYQPIIWKNYKNNQQSHTVSHPGINHSLIHMTA